MIESRAKSSSTSAADDIIVDIEHVLEFASGNTALAERFLHLFVEQSKIDLGHMINADNDENWLDAAHSLKSGASAIGAWRVVNAAEFAQNEKRALTASLRREHIDVLTMRIAEATAFIKQYINQD